MTETVEEPVMGRQLTTVLVPDTQKQVHFDLLQVLFFLKRIVPFLLLFFLLIFGQLLVRERHLTVLVLGLFL